MTILIFILNDQWEYSLLTKNIFALIPLYNCILRCLQVTQCSFFWLGRQVMELGYSLGSPHPADTSTLHFKAPMATEICYNGKRFARCALKKRQLRFTFNSMLWSAQTKSWTQSPHFHPFIPRSNIRSTKNSSQDCMQSLIKQRSLVLQFELI